MGRYLIVGSRTGIGQSLAQEFINDGHELFTLNRTPGTTERDFAANVVTDPLPQIDGPLDGLAYCPGSINLKLFGSLKTDDFLTDFNINVIGAVRVLQHYHRNLQQAPKAAVVMFGTVATRMGMPYHASIAAAKGAVEGLVRSLAAEWAPKIRVNCVAPSLTDTPLAARLLNTEAKRLAATERHPLKTVGNSNHVASLAKLLLTDTTSFVTGQVWYADGGISSIKP
jgi:3-oxoacyl-[acyl-carrier protein] reductase